MMTIERPLECPLYTGNDTCKVTGGQHCNSTDMFLPLCPLLNGVILNASSNLKRKTK